MLTGKCRCSGGMPVKGDALESVARFPLGLASCHILLLPLLARVSLLVTNIAGVIVLFVLFSSLFFGFVCFFP